MKNIPMIKMCSPPNTTIDCAAWNLTHGPLIDQQKNNPCHPSHCVAQQSRHIFLQALCRYSHGRTRGYRSRARCLIRPALGAECCRSNILTTRFAECHLDFLHGLVAGSLTNAPSIRNRIPRRNRSLRVLDFAILLSSIPHFWGIHDLFLQSYRRTQRRAPCRPQRRHLRGRHDPPCP